MELGETRVDATGPGWTLTLRGASGQSVVRLSPLDLEIGVLVGRAPKCNDELKTLLHDGISRVHLLLRRGRAYDLASTQGTYVNGQRVRSVALEDSGTDIRIGKDNPIFARWRAASG